MNYNEFKKSANRIETSDGYEKYVEYYFDKVWIQKSCRVTRFTKNKQYRVHCGTQGHDCRTLNEALHMAYELQCKVV